MNIGPYPLRNSYALAPMAGLTDVPFRTIAWQMGAGYMVSEMVSSKLELWETGKSRLRRIPVPGANPVAIQIAGTDPQVMAEAARRHADEGVQVIDINFGCPAKKVCKKLAGSALLADIYLIGKIVECVSRAVNIPVTIKTRTGLNPGGMQGVEAAVTAVQAGAQMVVMHGRSRACKFSGIAEYNTVKLVKSRVNVPVLVNGDIATAYDVKHALQVSAADGVMIGRGAMGQPWIFAELASGRQFDDCEKWQIIEKHVADMHEFYGELPGLRIARKHVAAYMQRLHLSHKIGEFQKIQSAKQQLVWLRCQGDQFLTAAIAS